MDIKKLQSILEMEGIKTQVKGNNIRENVDQDENYYELKYTDKKYYYNFVNCERQSYPDVSQIDEFNDLLDAIKVFIVHLLSSKYMNKAQNIISENIQVFIGKDKSSEDDIKKIMANNNIPNKYISFPNIPNKESILLKKTTEGWFTYYLDENKKKVFGSKVPCNMTEGYMRTIREGIMLKYLDDFLDRNMSEIKFSLKDKAKFLNYYYK